MRASRHVYAKKGFRVYLLPKAFKMKQCATSEKEEVYVMMPQF